MKKYFLHSLIKKLLWENADADTYYEISENGIRHNGKDYMSYLMTEFYDYQIYHGDKLPYSWRRWYVDFFGLKYNEDADRFTENYVLTNVVSEATLIIYPGITWEYAHYATWTVHEQEEKSGADRVEKLKKLVPWWKK